MGPAQALEVSRASGQLTPEVDYARVQKAQFLWPIEIYHLILENHQVFLLIDRNYAGRPIP